MKDNIILLNKNYKALYYDEKYYIYKEPDSPDAKRIIWIADNKEELDCINTKIEEYYKIRKNFFDTELKGKRYFNENIYVEILKAENQNRIFFTLYDKDNKIGSREININGLKTFLALDIFTISGGSQLKADYIGKGLGLFLYDTVDKTLPYQQIPHGYAGAPGCLTDDSKKFWERRKQKKILPVLEDKSKKILDYLSKLDNNMEISNKFYYLAHLYSNQFIENKNVFFDISKFLKYEKCYYLAFLNPEKQNFIQMNEDILKEDVKKSFLEFINDSYIDDNYISFDDFLNRVKEETFVNIDIVNKIISDLNLISEIQNIYKQKYPYKYPENIEIIEVIPTLDPLYSRNDSIFSSKNKNNTYSIGIIKSESYPYNNILRKIHLINVNYDQYLQIKKNGLDANILDSIKKDNTLNLTSTVLDMNKTLYSRHIEDACEQKYFAKYDGKYFCSNMKYDKNISIDKITVLTEMLAHVDNPQYIQLLKQEILKQLPLLVKKNPTTIIDDDNNITRTLYGNRTNEKSLDKNIIKEIMEEKKYHSDNYNLK